MRSREAGAARRHPWRIVVAVLCIVLLGGVCYLIVGYVFHGSPAPKSVSAVIRSFKASGATSSGKGLAYAPPAEGVYELRGKGTERISFPPNSQRDGTVMPASVTYLSDGCWRWHVDYNVAHWEEYDFCPGASDLLLSADRNFQSWDFGAVKIQNLASFKCPSLATVLPGDQSPAQNLTWSCAGTNTAVPGPSTAKTKARILAVVDLKIDGAAVPTVHERQQVTLSGAQKGTIDEDWWFTVSSGLPVRMERHITILTKSPVGSIDYHEAGSWQMVSLHPRT